MFQGFDDQSVDFMWGIRFNNNREWFLEHKGQYQEHLYEPMKALADEVYAALAKECREYGLICRVSRIYRDARRLHGKGLYKDHLWISIEAPMEDKQSVPVFWFELTPERWSYGLGFYMAPPLFMAKLRARMDRDPAGMEKLMRKLQAQHEFSLEGLEYKRPRSAAPSKLLEPWYLKKNFSIGHEEPLGEELFSHELVERLQKGYQFLMPFYAYFSTVNGDPDPRNQ